MIGPPDKIGLLLLFALIGISPAQAQDAAPVCDAATLAEGTRIFDEVGVFQEVIALLEPCLPDTFPEQQQQEEAHRLVILSYHELEDDESAEKWGISLMDINPKYQAPPNDSRYFQYMVETLRPKPWHRRWAWRGPIAGIVAGTAAFLILRPEDPVPLKPLPPAPPQ